MPVGFPDYYGGLTLPVTVPEGGTGQTSVTANALLYGAGTSKLIETNVGASNQILQINSVTLVPTFQDLSVDVSVITGILPVAHGGTGTATPTLTAGTNIGITGTWPGNTISVTDPPTFSSGTIVNGNLYLKNNTQAIISIRNASNAEHWQIGENLTAGAQGSLILVNFVSGNTSFYIDTSDVAHLFNPLPIASGGTGATSAGLTAGANIVVTGAWPNSTIALATLIEPDTDGGGIIVDSGGNLRLGLVKQSGFAGELRYLNTVAFNIRRVTSGTLVAPSASALPLAITTAGVVTIADGGLATIPTYNGFTLVGDGIPYFRALDDKTAQTGSIATHNLIASAAQGMYRLSVTINLHVTASASGNLTLTLSWTQNGVAQTNTIVQLSTASTGYVNYGFSPCLFSDGSTAIAYSTAKSGTATISYDLHIRLEKI